MNKLTLLLVLFFAGCSGILTETESGHAGVMTETETGVKGALVFENGDAADGAVVALLSSPEDNPLAKGSADTLKTVTTDSAGQYLFKKLTKGRYSISAYCYRSETKDTVVAHQSGIDVIDSQITDAGTSTLLLPGKIRSRVTAGGLPVEGALCYIMDQKDFYLSLTDRDGVCVIHNVSPGTYTVTFQKDTYLIQDVPGVEVEAEKTADAGEVFLKSDPDLPPPRPLGLQAVYDADSGTVLLSWLPVDVSDIDGYIIFRDDSGSTSETRITEGYLVTDSFFVDTVYLALSGFPAVLRYRIKAQDLVGDKSTFSEFGLLTITVPSRPFSPMPRDGADGQSLTPLLAWNGPDAGLGAMVVYDVYLDTLPGPEFIVSRGQSTPLINVPYSLEDGKKYYWKIIAYINGNAVSGPVWSFTTLATQPDNHPPVIPSSPTPYNGAARQDVFQLLLTWSGGDQDAGDVVSYDVYLDTKTGPDKKVITTTDTFYVVPALANNTDYFWQISASDGEARELGPVWQFRTRGVGLENTPPNEPSEPSPATQAADVAAVVTLSWTGGDSDSGDTVIYTLFLGTDNNNMTEYGTASTGTVREISGLAQSTKYYWRVTASDGQATTAGEIWAFTTRAADPANHEPVISLKLPANGAGDIDSLVTFSWIGSDDDPGDALEYTLYVDKVDPPLVMEALKMTDAAVSIALEPGQTYFWRVLVSDGKIGINSAVRSFSTKSRPNQPPEVVLVSPLDNSVGLERSVTLSWNGNDPDPDDIPVYSLFLDTLMPPEAIAASATLLASFRADLAPGKTYYWQVQVSDGEASGTSGIQSFSTAREERLVAYYPFSGNAEDATGNGRTGLVLGPVSAEDRVGEAGKAFRFDGINDEITHDAAGLPGSEGDNAHSVSFWLLPEAGAGTQDLVYWGKNTIQNGCVCILLFAEADGWFLNYSFYGNDVYTRKRPYSGWVHLAFTYDSEARHVYADGEESAYQYSGQPQGFSAGGSLRISDFQEFKTGFREYPFSGVIDEIRIYNYALTSAAVTEQWETTRGGIIPQGPELLAHWDFNDGGGSLLTDKSGNGNHGTLHGNPVWTSGVEGTALSFNGVTDYVMVPDASDLSGMMELTVTVWIQLPETPDFDALIYKWGPGGTGDDSWGITLINDNWSAGLMNQDRQWTPSTQAAYQPGLRPGKWTLLAFVYDGSSLSMYTNGDDGYSFQTIQGPLQKNTEPLVIGAQETSDGVFGNFTRGLIDEIKIYRGALTRAEIQAQWQQYSRSLPGESGLAAYYPFSGSAADFSGNRNHGSVSGAAAASDRFGNANSAFRFDGFNNYIDCGGGSSLNLDGKSFTLSVWAKLDATGQYHTFISKGDQGVYNEVLLYSIRSWNDLSLAFYGDDLDVPFLYSTEPWYHLAVTYDILSGMRSMYVNGTVHVSGAVTHIGLNTEVSGIQPSPGLSNTDGEHLLLGKRRLLPGGELPLYGTLDDVRIYTRVLSASEIESLYGEGGWTGNR